MTGYVDKYERKRRKIMKRKNMWKKLVSMGMVVAMLGTMTACGSDSKTASGDAEASTTQSGDTIKVGIIDDATGNNASMGVQKIAAYKLAAQEINDAGGINGKQVQLLVCDGQSDNTVYQQMANKLCQDDKVDVVMGGLTSASREAIRPIMDQNKMLYFYNQQYEGGVADHYTFCLGAAPEQQILPALGDVLDKYGKNVYIIAADYNFGQISADWMEQVVDEAGGTVLGEEFIPLDVSSFSSTISNIEKAKPDVLISLLVGSNHTSFYEQWNNAGNAGLPMFTTVSIVETYEHKLFPAPTMSNTYVLASYLEELDTDAAKKFTEAYRAVNSEEDIPYIGMDAETCYSAMYLYKAAVEKAGSTDTEAVISALESGEISFDGPGGTVTIDGATHHTTRDMTLFKCNDKEELEILKTYPSIKPTYLSEDCGVDLRKEDPCKQFTPLDQQ